MKISKAQLVEMRACGFGLERFTKQTGNTDEPVDVASLVGGENTTSDLLWLAHQSVGIDRMFKLACDCLVATRNMMADPDVLVDEAVRVTLSIPSMSSDRFDIELSTAEGLASPRIRFTQGPSLMPDATVDQKLHWAAIQQSRFIFRAARALRPGWAIASQQHPINQSIYILAEETQGGRAAVNDLLRALFNSIGGEHEQSMD